MYKSKYLFLIPFILIIVSCDSRYAGGEISLKNKGFPFFISEMIDEVYATKDMVIIELSEADNRQLTVYANNVYEHGDLLDVYVNEDLYFEGIALAPSSGGTWEEIKLPRLEGMKALFEKNNIEVVELKELR
jgi:hypothetical protein